MQHPPSSNSNSHKMKIDSRRLQTMAYNYHYGGSGSNNNPNTSSNPATTGSGTGGSGTGGSGSGTGGSGSSGHRRSSMGHLFDMLATSSGPGSAVVAAIDGVGGGGGAGGSGGGVSLDPFPISYGSSSSIEGVGVGVGRCDAANADMSSPGLDNSSSLSAQSSKTFLDRIQAQQQAQLHALRAQAQAQAQAQAHQAQHADSAQQQQQAQEMTFQQFQSMAVRPPRLRQTSSSGSHVGGGGGGGGSSKSNSRAFMIHQQAHSAAQQQATRAGLAGSPFDQTELRHATSSSGAVFQRSLLYDLPDEEQNQVGGGGGVRDRGKGGGGGMDDSTGSMGQFADAPASPHPLLMSSAHHPSLTRLAGGSVGLGSITGGAGGQLNSASASFASAAAATAQAPATAPSRTMAWDPAYMGMTTAEAVDAVPLPPFGGMGEGMGQMEAGRSGVTAATAAEKRRRSSLGLSPCMSSGGSSNPAFPRNVRPNLGYGLGAFEDGLSVGLGGGATMGGMAGTLLGYGGGNKVSAAQKPSVPAAKPSMTTSSSRRSPKPASLSLNEPTKASSSSSIVSKTLKSVAVKASVPKKTKSASSAAGESSSGAIADAPRSSSPTSPTSTAKSRDRARKDARWMDMLSQLRAYKSENGDCIVPRGYAFNTKLASWVAEQRKQYRLKACGKPSNITPERVSLLDAMGFAWNAQEAAWARHFEDLKRYRDLYGDCMVPLSFTDYPQLGLWVKEQRRHYTLLKQGKHSHMTPERIAKLESVTFTWDSHEATWWERFRELRQYREYFGDCLVPTKYSANPKLGTWVHHQRRQYRMLREGRPSHMTQRRIEALEDIGFNWAPRANQGKGESSVGGGAKSSAASSSAADGNKKREEEEEESISSVPSKEYNSEEDEDEVDAEYDEDMEEDEEEVEVSHVGFGPRQSSTKARAA